MKKVLYFALLLLFSVVVIGCTGTTETSDTTTTEDTTPPVIMGVEDVTIYTDSTFDPLEGVTATDNVDGDITDQITVTGTVDTSTEGTSFLKYSVSDEAGNKTEKTRYVTVEIDPSLIGDEMVPNGDFSLGWSVWETTTGAEGGMGNFEVVDGVLEVEVTAVSAQMFEPRLENNGIEFENGKTYLVTFDAKADAARAINVSIGELLSGAPWFNNFKEGQTDIFELTTAWETYSFKFTMTQDTNENGSLLFEHGTVTTEDLDDTNLLTTVYYDNIAIVESTPDPDETEPILSGVGDVTLETGATFDPLEGVEAFDARDGEITLTSEHYTSDVDTSTPGTYTVTYTVSDEAGNIATAERTVTVVDLIFNETGMVTNGDFETALDTEDPEWFLYEATGWDGAPNADGTLSIDTGQLKLEVISEGDDGAFESWRLQAGQYIDFQKGYTYKIVFDAKADAARALSSFVGYSNTDTYAWVEYGGGEFDLTTEYQTFEYMFTVTQDSEPYLEELKFEFGQAAETVYIDNVKVLQFEDGPAPQNGSFEDIGWDLWAGEGGAATVSIVDGEAAVDITSVGNQTYSVQFNQPGIELVSGTEYKVSFDAYALTNPRDIIFKLLDSSYFDQMTSSWEGTTVSLTTSPQTFEYTFTAGADASVKYYFDMGLIGTPGADTIYFDNLKIEEYDGTDVVADTNQVVNGTFDQLLDWFVWSQDWDEGNGIPNVTYTVENGEFELTTDFVGDYNYSIQLVQEGIELTPGATYTVEFKAKASAARAINFKVIDGDATEFPADPQFSLTTEYQTFTFTFTYDGTATTGKISVEMGEVPLDSVVDPGTIWIDDVLLYRNLNEATAE